MLNSLFSETTSNVELSTILICSLVSIILGLIIALVHKYTSRSNKNFLITLTVLPLLVECVMIMVNGNLGTSVAILGAFGLIRFRSLPGNSKEILSVFFAMAIGLATGMGHIAFAGIITVITSIVIIILSKVKIFDDNSKEKILRIAVPENLDYESMFSEEFKKYTKRVELQKVKTTNMGSLFELSYIVELKEKVSEKAFIDDLRVKNGNLKITLSHSLEEENL
ncbi:MAG: DUF4956 domain-containing protein [Bacilli bacterium]